MRRIGDMMFGTRHTGITPEFARVLRTEILDKDERWFLLEPGAGGPRAPSAGPLRAHVRLASRDKTRFSEFTIPQPAEM